MGYVPIVRSSRVAFNQYQLASSLNPQAKDGIMTSPREERGLHDGFLAGIAFKAAVGALQLIAGIALLAIDQQTLAAWVAHLTTPELIEEPGSHIAAWANSTVADLGAGSRTFVTIYLISHGVIKLGLIWAMLRRQMWAYPWSMWAFGGFIAYQLYRFAFTHSMMLIVLSVLDAIVVYLIWHEYRTRKAIRYAAPITRL